MALPPSPCWNSEVLLCSFACCKKYWLSLLLVSGIMLLWSAVLYMLLLTLGSRRSDRLVLSLAIFIFMMKCEFLPVSFLWEDVEVQSYSRRGIHRLWVYISNWRLGIHKCWTCDNRITFVFVRWYSASNQGSNKDYESWQEANSIVSEDNTITTYVLNKLQTNKISYYFGWRLCRHSLGDWPRCLVQ